MRDPSTRGVRGDPANQISDRWAEAFLPPGIERVGAWNYGHQYIGWHLVATKSALEGAPDELSLYAGESYWTGQSSALWRYTLRLDGFVSVNAPMSGGEIVTKSLRFQGRALALNFATSAAGGSEWKSKTSGESLCQVLHLEIARHFWVMPRRFS